jgi:hypothetical protein
LDDAKLQEFNLEERNTKIEEIIEYLKSREPNHDDEQLETVKEFLKNMYPVGQDEINVQIEEQDTSN